MDVIPGIRQQELSPKNFCFRFHQFEKGIIMLSWTILFLIVALIAGVLGFSGIAGTAAGIAQVLFVIFLIMFLVSLITGRRSV
jgi:uncharacterized membrane protein YtjA (UPF0391 family)